MEPQNKKYIGYGQQYYWEHREQRLAYAHKWMLENKEHLRAYNAEYKKRNREKLSILGKQNYQEHREHYLLLGIRRSVQVKYEVLLHYSQTTIPQCVWCGERDIDVLCIDHINNDGAIQRKQTGKSAYKWLRKIGFPDGYQTLCANCNLKKKIRGDNGRTDREATKRQIP